MKVATSDRSGVTIRAPRLTGADGKRQAVASLEVDGEHHEIHYWLSDECSVRPSADALLPLGVLTGILGGRAVHCVDEVSARLAGNVPAIMELWSAWTELPAVAVSAPTRPPQPRGHGVGAFFSGGIDSYYTLMQHQEEITHLIVVVGFDVPLQRTALREKVLDGLRRAAHAFGKPLLVVDTDLRDVLDRYVTWEDAHGAALASVGHLLSPMFSKIYIAGTGTYATLLPWGTHPMLDHLWSSDETDFVSDGYAAARFQKLERLLAYPVMLETLRVCWRNYDDQYNCGRCGKCLQAMSMLRALGVLRDAKTFPQRLDLRSMAEECAVGAMTSVNHLFQRSLRMSLDRVRSAGDDPKLAAALRDCLANRYQRGWWPLWRRITYRLRSLLRGVQPWRS